MNQVGIVMGSDSDYSVMEDAIKVLKEFGVSYEVKVSSAHRTLERTLNWVSGFEGQGGKVIIAGAGMAAHLPGVVAGATTLPVIGVPIRSGALEGVDALYAIVQMPPGVPVATVGINGAKNGGLLAVQMIALSDQNLRVALKDYRVTMAEGVEAKDKALQEKLK
ncbi:5-(carboxyamino)imidazole ribonucleotide mutase [Desulfitobacterium dichloroeliminans LMG P-21439]|uniref:N5-carboxyaminoimidazole ribonucleotide mutase n=1 Tax=Desulfitobacterium dichloroeliminans (strain LMG P-21439 / DCA1) TaxID=871963 RepID=L0F6S8_DESDL|nr:5-(carboxyamino)imidazole ribonucleotide mutase [Desulfitobacterium dichloroeliminans]AGA68730.1 5-(carboxyamino)imidazole ribonucleotide mutase [Desulfitobacterium dichloroeliminans LMG P-21439]